VRTSNAIDLSTRTLLTEVDVPNASGLLLPGGYAQVTPGSERKGDRLQVPVNSLLFARKGCGRGSGCEPQGAAAVADHRPRLRVTLEVLNG